MPIDKPIYDPAYYREFSPLVVAELSTTYESIMERLNKTWLEAANKLTKEQFVDAMVQAIECGDFLRLLTAGETSLVDTTATYRHKQAITYLPYRKVERLKTRIRELEAELERLESVGQDADTLT